MKILLFLPNLGGGGTERAVVNLSKEFLRRGIEVKLVTLEPTVDLETDPDGVVCLGVPKSTLRVKRPLYWYGSVRRLVRLTKREQPQALVSFLTGPNYMAGIARLFFRGPRLILSERTVVSDYLKGWVWRFVKVSMRLVYRVADGIIVNSGAIASDLEALGVRGRRIVVIPNPADLEEIVRLSEEPLGELESFFRGPVICAAGRLEEDKGYPYLLGALQLPWRRRAPGDSGEGEPGEGVKTNGGPVGRRGSCPLCGIPDQSIQRHQPLGRCLCSRRCGKVCPTC